MDFYTSTSQREFSQKKLEAYENMAKVINWGRKNPIKFAEHFFGLALLDYQKFAFMESWCASYVLWLMCRGAGKDTLAAVYFMTRLLLIPNYRVYVSSNSAAQSAESFMKLEDIALQRIPSFQSATNVFAEEVVKSNKGHSGFTHGESYEFQLYNNSKMITVSSNVETVRGKRGAVWFNETAWQSSEEFAVMENFANVDSNFSTSTDKNKKFDPIQMPLQLMYTSSAGDVEFPFFEKYKTFAKKMFLGNRDYFCIDIDAYDILYHTTLDGEPIKSHLSENQIKKAIEEDSEAADRELFNKFRKGSGKNAVISMDTIIRNSVIRKPLLHNDTGKRKFILTYDPARNYDGSILTIFEVINDKNVGYRLRIDNCISMVDEMSDKKTPLPMPEQLKIIKENMIRYNGERAAEWENIELWIDAGSGGGGVSGVADQLMSDWVDEMGQKHRGVIDPVHKQYTTARKKYVNAMPIVRLIEPIAYKKAMYDALAKMGKLNLIEFTSYDSKDYILIEDKNGEFKQESLNFEEMKALSQIELLKTEASYMCRYDTSNGGVTYDLLKEKKNTMHDDRADTLAMGAYALSLLRRSDLITQPTESLDMTSFKKLARSPKMR